MSFASRLLSPRLWRRLAIIAGLTLLLTAVLLALLPTFLLPALNKLLPSWLGEQGKASISELSWHHLVIDEFQLTQDDGTVLQINGLDLTFSPTGLLNGEIKTLNIDSVLLNMSQQKAQQVARDAAENARAEALRQFNQAVDIPAFSQWLSLPADSINIAEIEFIHPQLSAELSADITPELWRINGDVKITSLPLPWNMEVQLQKNGDWLMMLSEQQTLLTQMFGHIDQDEQFTHLHIDHRADLAAISERLPQLQGLPLPLKDLFLRAEILLPNHGVLPRDAVIGSIASITSDSHKLPGDVRLKKGQWSLSLTKTDADSDWLFRLDGSPQQLVLYPASPLAALLPAPAGNNKVLATIHSNQTFTAQCDAALSDCSADGNFTNRLTSAAGELADLNVSSQLQWQKESGLQLTLPLTLHSSEKLALPLQSGDISGELRASLMTAGTDAGHWQVQSDKGFITRVTIDMGDKWQRTDINGELLANLAMSGNLQQGSMTSSPLQLKTSALILKPKKKARAGKKTALNISTSAVSCLPKLTTNGLIASCNIDLKLAKSSFDGWPVPDASINGPVFLDLASAQRVMAKLDITAANQQAKLRAQLQHDIATGQGSLQWHLDDTIINWNKMNLSEMLALSKTEILSGSVAGQGWADWQMTDKGIDVTPDIMLRADNVSFTYDSSIALDDWNGLFALRRPFKKDFWLDAQLSGRSLNPGVNFTNILARTQTRIPADFSYVLADIYEINTNVLGGRVHVPEVRFDTRNDTNTVGIVVDHVQLAQIAALEPSADVNANGTLDGVLPIMISKTEGIKVPAGTLFAREPGGTIRYDNSTSDSLGQTNQAVGMAMQALQNFQYDKLQSNVKYAPDGSLNLGLQFEGKNPDFFDGQKTELNVNLEYNLLDLLESLRIANDTISTLEEKYKQ